MLPPPLNQRFGSLNLNDPLLFAVYSPTANLVRQEMLSRHDRRNARRDVNGRLLLDSASRQIYAIFTRVLSASVR